MSKKWYSFLEIATDRIVPFAVIALLIVIILEFFFAEIAEAYHTAISIADYSIVGIFILDLIFKYLRIKKFKNFLKECWLDIIAVFPFFLIFRVFESFLILAELPKELRQAQLLLHEGLVVSEESSKIIKEAEQAGKISRVKTIIRMFRAVEDSPKLVKALAFYEQPVGEHHLHEVKGKKEFKKLEKEVKKDIKIVEKDVGRVAKKIEKVEEIPKRMLKKKKRF